MMQMKKIDIAGIEGRVRCVTAQHDLSPGTLHTVLQHRRVVMASYVDVFVVPVPNKNIRTIARTPSCSQSCARARCR